MHSILNAISNIFNEKEESPLLKRANHKYGIKNNNEPQYNYLSNDAMVKLEKIFSADVPMETGQIKLLGLENLKKKLGDQWPTSVKSIHEHLITITEKHISDKDVFFSKSDDEFIIVFASVSGKIAKLVAAKILQELTEKYLGSTDTKDIIVKTAVKEIDGKLLFEAEDLDFLLGQIDSANSDNIPKINSVNTNLNPAKEDESFTYLYRPVWDVKNEVITTYLVTAGTQILESKKGILEPGRTGHDVLKDKFSQKSRIALERLVLSSNISILEELYHNSFRTVFNIPLSYETVFNVELLKAYTLRCKTIPPFLKKYIIFSMHDFPIGIPNSKLHFIAYSLKNHCNALTFHASTCDIDIEKFATCGIKIISINLHGQGQSSRKNWQSIIPFVTKCKKEKIFVALENVNSKEDIALAKDNGVDYISGDAVGGYRDTVGTMKRVSLNTLIREKYY